jgi:aminoglycoside phosphotransferase family enzyme/predicted kinase
MSGFAAQRATQERIADWLRSLAPDAERFDTHASIVVLAGGRAYKVKRALDVGWMDFSTVEKRRLCCLNELALNRRTAPELYLAVEPVLAAGDGFRLGGAGEPVDWILVMRRFDSAQRFDRLLADGRLDRALIEATAVVVLDAQRRAPVRQEAGGAPGIARVAGENAHDLAAVDAVPAALQQALRERTAAAVERHGALLEARREAGWVRHCHGDLHLANIVLWRAQPTLFDCIEFNDALARVDVLYDVAFLLMDLDRHGRRDLANAALERWLEDEAQTEALALLPLFLSVRAGVRAKVAALAAAEVPARRAELVHEAEDYARRALAYLSPPPPRLLAVGGFSGTGKTSLARCLAPQVGAAPGALLIRSDVVRKRLFGVAPETRLPLEAYTPEWHARVAAAMTRQAGAALAAGHSVLLDAVHGSPASQQAVEAIAAAAGVPFQGFWLSAPLPVLEERIRARQGDASDATVEVVRRQVANGEAASAWTRLDAAAPLDRLARQALEALQLL